MDGKVEVEMNPDRMDMDMGMDMDDIDVDVDSLDSEDLHETRPNRWRGHPETWRKWTELDRATWTALENARKEDLAVHLYNAYGLRRGFRVGPMVADDVNVNLDYDGDDEDGDGEGEDGQRPWKLDKAWTAWPMRADEVPDDGLMPRTIDVNEPFTLRREETQTFAGVNLEEEISATILRRAKEKFRKRDLQQTAEDEQALPSVEQGDADATAAQGETDASDTAATSAVDDETEAETDASHRRPRKRRRRGASPTFTPVFSADDDRSYMLLRPAARRIMEKLDHTLMILHNQRAAGLGNISESSASDEDETESEEMSIRPSVSPEKSPAPRKNRGGRPRKVNVPLEGETEQEMTVRLAKENHRRNPFLTDTPGSGEDERSRSQSRSQSRSRSLGRGRQSSLPSLAESRASSVRSSLSRKSGSRSSSASSTNREKLLGRWGLRDWRDVLGAAALAGFSPSVIARAAQRCSTLFREEMTLHTLHERSAASGQVELETVRYVPGAALPPSSDEDDDESEAELAQTRTISRYSSVRLPEEMSPEPTPQTPRASRSATPATGLLCPHPGCPRAMHGFKKRWNLERHMQTVHKGHAPASPEPEPQTRRGGRSETAAALVCSYPGCSRATRAFKTRTALDKHIRTVHESQTSQTSQTGGFIQLTPIELEKTLRDLDRSGAHGLRACPVPGCPRGSKSFQRWAKVVRHIRTVHGKGHVAGSTELELTEPEEVPRQRGQLATPAPANLLCPIPDCPRATRPFKKWSHLKRHVRELHKEQAADYLTEPELTELDTSSKQGSRSTTPGAVYFCHFSHCPRAVDGFSKVTNFKRHMQTVHGKSVANVAEEGEDSMDEMHGGAHLDGFLKPIKFRRGWRTADTQVGRHRSRKGTRDGPEEL